jgi:8-oxo-dGTP diphosphatase
MAKATIVYIVDPDLGEVLMAKKVRKVGIGYYFGYGGKIEDGESPEDCTVRETKKESGGTIVLDKSKLQAIAHIRFFNKTEQNPLTDEPTFEVLCYRIFAKKADIGTPPTTDEMADPTWFQKVKIPFGTTLMKPGDELFVPNIIDGIYCKGYIHFTDDEKEVLSSSIELCGPQDLVLAS